MALARVKTWSSGEVLLASDLNSEFNNILNNARNLISPLTASLDMDAFELILDGDADTSLTADTDDRLDVRLGGVDLFIFDGTAALLVNGITYTGAATGARPRVAPHGSDTNIGLAIRPKGTGAGASVVIEDGSGNEVVIAGVATASAVNEVTVTNAATGNPPRIHASGETNVSLQMEPKGTGTVLMTDGTDTTKKVSMVLSGITTGTTRTVTMPDYNVTLGNIPAGVIMDYGGSSVPTGWLECDGSAVSRTTYANLFTAVSTTWGTGDGSTTFNLPDFRGRTRVGKGTGTVAETVAAASVSTGSDNFTVAANNTKWITGQPVILTTTGGLPAGLSLATTYYLVRASSTTIQFATTLANAQNGTVIDITSQGTGNHTLTGTLTARTLAEIGGEETHAMSSTELLAHVHSSVVSAGAIAAGGAAVNPVNAGDTGSKGGNAAMNIMPPFGVTMAIIKY